MRRPQVDDSPVNTREREEDAPVHRQDLAWALSASKRPLIHTHTHQPCSLLLCSRHTNLPPPPPSLPFAFAPSSPPPPHLLSPPAALIASFPFHYNSFPPCSTRDWHSLVSPSLAGALRSMTRATAPSDTNECRARSAPRRSKATHRCAIVQNTRRSTFKQKHPANSARRMWTRTSLANREGLAGLVLCVLQPARARSRDDFTWDLKNNLEACGRFDDLKAAVTVDGAQRRIL